MGLFSGFTKTKKDLPEELKAVRLKPKLGTKVFDNYATAVANKDYKNKDLMKWIKHTDSSKRARLVADLEDGLYKIIGMIEVNKVGIFYEILPEDIEDQEDKKGLWVAKDDIWESNSE